MSARHKIPTIYHDKILELVAEGKRSTGIAIWLKTEKNITVGAWTVSQLIKRLTKERKPYLEAALAEKASQTAFNDLDIVGETIELLHREALKSMDKKQKNEARLLLETMGRFIDRRMSLLGIGDGKSHGTYRPEVVLQGLMEKIKVK